MIEYAGNVIRSILTDKREKYYDSKVSLSNSGGTAETQLVMSAGHRGPEVLLSEDKGCPGLQ